MKIFKSLLTFLVIILTFSRVEAVQFNVVVLPTDLFKVCDNYFCFPEASEIASEYVIQNLNSYKNISAYTLADVRAKMYADKELAEQTAVMLDKFAKIDRIDFAPLKKISDEFGVKSIILISSWISNEETLTKRNLWEILQISSAFQISHPFTLNTNAVLTDTVNNTVMWSGRYTVKVTDSNDMFKASNQAQAASQLEKIKQYYKNNIAQTISQNIRLRFFPKTVRTFTTGKQTTEQKQFMPNALEHLSKPKLESEINELYKETTADDLIFDF
ncbi:MAG: hypothetical protein NC191_01150 [Muribaculaceae bacterium]|nr:hypothetical protein [Muribaculaceae bacterium]